MGISEYESFLRGAAPQALEKQALEKQAPEEEDRPRLMTTHFIKNHDDLEEQHELILTSMDETSGLFYSVDEKGAKIGRNEGNQVVLHGYGISAYHAEVSFLDGQFKLTDLGSSSGTYLKLGSPLELRRGTIVELGSQQLTVLAHASDALEVSITNGFEKEHLVIELGKEDYFLGRK